MSDPRVRRALARSRPPSESRAARRRIPLGAVAAVLWVITGVAHADNLPRRTPTPAPPAVRSGLPPVRSGPVADFEPMRGVISHVFLREVDPALDRLLEELLGERHYVETYDPCGSEPGHACDRWPADRMGLWARDYAPIFVRRANGGLKVVRYLSQNPNRSFYGPAISRRPRHPLHRTTLAAAAKTPLPMELLPLIHEQGNLVSTGRRVIVANRLLDENSVPSPDPHLDREGYRVRTPEEIIQVLTKTLEVQPSDLVVLPGLPRESTGHIDLYVMALDENTILIPVIPRDALAMAEGPMERSLGAETAAFLDHHAGMLTSLGLRVERLPMLPPLLAPSADGVSGHFDPLYVTPTNALLIRTDVGADVVLPSVRVPGRGPEVERLRERIERTWSSFFQRRGYTPHFVEATELARRGGLVRCVTAPIPR